MTTQPNREVVPMDRLGEDRRSVGYWVRYAVAWVALCRLVPNRLSWWLVTRMMP